MLKDTQIASLQHALDAERQLVKRQSDLLADLAVVFPTIKKTTHYPIVFYDLLWIYDLDKIRRAAERLRVDQYADTNKKLGKLAVEELRNLGDTK